MLKLADLVSLFYMVDENGITVTVINADGGPLTLKQYEDIFKFIIGSVTNCNFRSRINKGDKTALEKVDKGLCSTVLLVLKQPPMVSMVFHLFMMSKLV